MAAEEDVQTATHEADDMPDKPKTSDNPQSAWREFLESVPPGTSLFIKDLFHRVLDNTRDGHWELRSTDIQLNCINCDGPRLYHLASSQTIGSVADQFLTYRCKNCGRTLKTFSVRFSRKDKDSGDTTVLKYGEIPSYGPPLPSRLVTLLREDADLLSKGRRAENQSMGIGAFGYYRRVVENQKAHLIAEVRKVAEKEGADPSVLALYDEAIQHQQFMRAVETIKDSIPKSLLTENENPLVLLHDALSDGLTQSG